MSWVTREPHSNWRPTGWRKAKSNVRARWERNSAGDGSRSQPRPTLSIPFQAPSCRRLGRQSAIGGTVFDPGISGQTSWAVQRTHAFEFSRGRSRHPFATYTSAAGRQARHPSDSGKHDRNQPECSQVYLIHPNSTEFDGIGRNVRIAENTAFAAENTAF